jgi:hypothetical protein
MRMAGERMSQVHNFPSRKYQFECRIIPLPRGQHTKLLYIETRAIIPEVLLFLKKEKRGEVHMCTMSATLHGNKYSQFLWTPTNLL